jgi:hypothetical protein
MDGEEHETALLPPLIRDCLAQQLKVVTIAGGASLAALRLNLDGLAVVTAEREAQGQLSLMPWTKVYRKEAGFDPGEALDTVEAIFSSGAQDTRYGGVRLVAQMDWVVSAAGGGRDVTAYERGLDRLVKDYAQSALCVYDLHRLSGQLLLDILSIHEFALVRGELLESPFYQEPK